MGGRHRRMVDWRLIDRNHFLETLKLKESLIFVSRMQKSLNKSKTSKKGQETEKRQAQISRRLTQKSADWLRNSYWKDQNGGRCDDDQRYAHHSISRCQSLFMLWNYPIWADPEIWKTSKSPKDGQTSKTIDQGKKSQVKNKIDQ